MKKLDTCLIRARPLVLLAGVLASGSSVGLQKELSSLEEERDTVRVLKSSTESRDLEKNQSFCFLCCAGLPGSSSSATDDVLFVFLGVSSDSGASLTLWVPPPRCLGRRRPLEAEDKGGLGFQGTKMSCFSNLRLFCSMAHT